MSDHYKMRKEIAVELANNCERSTASALKYYDSDLLFRHRRDVLDLRTPKTVVRDGAVHLNDSGAYHSHKLYEQGQSVLSISRKFGLSQVAVSAGIALYQEYGGELIDCSLVVL